MRLFDIDTAIEACVDMETGEIVDVEKLDALKMERKTKIRNIACWVKDLAAEAEALKKQKDGFAAREKAARNKAERLKDYLATCLDGKGTRDTEYQISFRESKATQILDEAQIPTKYRTPQPDKIEKAEILKALKAGEEVAGCALITRQGIIIK